MNESKLYDQMSVHFTLRSSKRTGFSELKVNNTARTVIRTSIEAVKCSSASEQ